MVELGQGMKVAWGAARRAQAGQAGADNDFPEKGGGTIRFDLAIQHDRAGRALDAPGAVIDAIPHLASEIDAL